MNDVVRAYRGAVKAIVENEWLFKSFKTHPAYTPVLEHVTVEMGAAYLEEIIEMDPKLFMILMETYRKNDDIGNPMVGQYGKYGKFSPTTLRYVHTLFTMLQKFGIPFNQTIVEFGGGYGGFCKIIQDTVPVGRYIIYDLPEVNQLINKYLSKYSLTEGVEIDCYTEEDMVDEYVDIFVSTFAIAEVPRELQVKVYDNLIRPSQNGFVIYNNLTDTSRFTADEFEKKIRDDFAEVRSWDDPHTPSKVIIWRQKPGEIDWS